MSLFTILVDIAASTASFETGMQRAEQELKGFAANVSKVTKTAGGILGVAVTFDALRQSITSAIARGDELQRLSERMNTTTETLSRMGYVADLADIEFATLASSLDTFTKNVGMAAGGTGKAEKVLKQLGINAKEFSKLSLEDQLDAIADKIAGIENPARQTAAAMALFGSADILTALRNGSAGLQELRDEADRTGRTLSTEAAESLAKADDAIKRLDLSSQTLATTLAVLLAPALAAVATGANAFLTGDFTKNLSAQLAELADRRRELLDQERNIQTSKFSKFLLGDQADEALAKVRTNLAGVEAAMSRVNDLLLAQDKRANRSVKRTEVPFVDLSAVNKRLETMRVFAENIKYFEQIDSDLNDRAESSRRRRSELNDALKEGIGEGVVESARQAMDSIGQVSDTIEEKIKKNAASLSEFAKSAAQNMQTQFADFLFDPFENGLRGMLLGFVNTIRRMVAEALSAKILEAIGIEDFLKSILGTGKKGGSSSGGGWLSSAWGFVSGLFGGNKAAKADGGPVQPGLPYLVGERGPELAMFSRAGYIMPNRDVQRLTRMSGSQPGGASRVVERVTTRITPRVNVQFNISTPDANSFRRAQSQIAARMGFAVSRATQRNL